MLTQVAFNRERSSARKLAQSENRSFYSALFTVLSSAAQTGCLQILVAERLNAISRNSERRAERVRLKDQEFQEKRSRKRFIPRPTESHWKAWFDGSALPNPGRIGVGGVLIDPEGHEQIVSCGMGHGDNSVAEYRALIAVLELARKAEVKNLIIYGDSKVVIDDMSGVTPIRIVLLHVFRDQARKLLEGFESYTLVWIPRTQNTRADCLARRAR